MTMLREPRPRLPRSALVTALLGGAVAGAMLGVGLSLVNLVLVALAFATLVGAGIGVLAIMWGSPGDVLDEDLLVEIALPLAAAAGAGAVVGIGSLVVAWLVLRRRIPVAGPVVAASAAITASAMLVLGTISTAAFIPALTLIGGAPAVPSAIGIAVCLGLLGAPLGALATWWMAWLMRSRRLALDAARSPYAAV